MLMIAGLLNSSMISVTINVAFPIHTCRFAMRVVAMHDTCKTARHLREQENNSESESKK
jgi:hypothetical protein